MAVDFVKLKDPLYSHTFRKPILLNHNEMILSSQYNLTNDIPGIYKYFIDKNETKLFIEYNKEDYLENRHDFSYNTAAFDQKNNKLYIYDGFSKHLLIIDLETRLILFKQCKYKIGLHPVSIVVDEQFHVIGGGISTQHIVWNDKNNQFEGLHKFEDLNTGLFGADIIYIQSKKCLFLFGGMDGVLSMNSIYIYSFIDKKWTKSKTKLPIKSIGWSAVATSNEKYIILFISIVRSIQNQKRGIYIMNIDTMQITESTLQLPYFSSIFAVANVSYNRNNVLIYGYIRNQSVRLPSEINSVILMFYNLEYIYLFDTRWTVSPKYKIATQDILWFDNHL